MNEITLDTVRQAGVVGAGGAGFPTHVKLSARADTVVLNGAECEPLLHKDKELLRNHPDTVLEGLRAAVRLVGAERAVIGVKRKYSDVLDILRPRLSSRMSLALLDDIYPAGDEFVLVYNTLGRIIPPGKLPLDVGAVVMNVETAFNVARSPVHPVTDTVVTVAGAVAEPVTLRVPVGAPLSACIERAGGPTVTDPACLVGGVMMGYLEEDLQAPVRKTTGGILVLPADHVAVRRRRRTWRHVARIARSCCDQCSFCTQLCPRYLLGHPVEPHRAMRSLMFNLAGDADAMGTQFCCECNLCTYYSCPEELDPRSVCVETKRRLASEGKRWMNPSFNSRRAALHMADRKAPMERLLSRLGLKQYRNNAPLRPDRLAVDRVRILLSQHIGAPCEPVVKVGQEVEVGDPVGVPPTSGARPALGAPIHASIEGVVAAVDGESVRIHRQ